MGCLGRFIFVFGLWTNLWRFTWLIMCLCVRIPATLFPRIVL